MPTQPVDVMLVQRYGGVVIRRAWATVPCRSDITVVHLAAGEYLLVALQKGGTSLGPPSAMEQILLTTADADVHLDLALPQRVSGQIELENANRSLLRQVMIRLTPTEGAAGEGHTSPDDEGRFELFVYPGRMYDVVVTGVEAPNYLKEIKYNGSDLHGMIFEPDWNSPSHSLHVLVSGRAGTLEGTVSPDGKAVVGALVMIARWPLSLSDGYPAYETATTGERGRFRKAGLKPGVYRIIAVSDTAARRLQKSQDLMDALAIAEEVQVPEAGTKVVTVNKLQLY